MKPNNNYNNIIIKTTKAVENYMNDLNDVSHDFIHICLVLKFAVMIAKKEGIINQRELFHIKMGALLHDIGDSKYTKDNQAIIINSFINKNISGINRYDKKEIIRISSNISLSKDNYCYDNEEPKIGEIRLALLMESDIEYEDMDNDYKNKVSSSMRFTLLKKKLAKSNINSLIYEDVLKHDNYLLIQE